MLQNSSLPKKKLVTIGDAQTGKTSLLWRLTHKQRPDIRDATIGAAFFNSSSKKFCLNMWDTAGQERFRSMLPIYLRDAEIILFVYDITDRSSYDHLNRYWINFALTHSSPQIENKKVSSPHLDTPKRNIDIIPMKRSQTLPTNINMNTFSSSPMDSAKIGKPSPLQFGTSPSQFGTSPSQFGTSPSQFGTYPSPLWGQSGSSPQSPSVLSNPPQPIRSISVRKLNSSNPQKTDVSQKRKNTSPFCFVITNKSDLSKERTVTKEEGEILAQSINAVFIELSALTGSNTDKIFHVLDSQLDVEFDETPDTDTSSHQIIYLDDSQQGTVTKLFSCCGN
jgi:GTPase SAR1 family protein